MRPGRAGSHAAFRALAALALSNPAEAATQKTAQIAPSTRLRPVMLPSRSLQPAPSARLIGSLFGARAHESIGVLAANHCNRVANPGRQGRRRGKKAPAADTC